MKDGGNYFYDLLGDAPVKSFVTKRLIGLDELLREADLEAMTVVEMDQPHDANVRFYRRVVGEQQSTLLAGVDAVFTTERNAGLVVR